MKKIYHRFIVIFTVTTIILSVTVFISMILIQWKQSVSYLQDVLRDSSNFLIQSEKDHKAREELLKLDYLNRAEAINFMIQKDSHLTDSSLLDEVRKALWIEEIYALDDERVILYSSNKSKVGTRLTEVEKTVESILNENNKNYGFYLKRDSVNNNILGYSVCLRVNGSDYSMLVIDCPPENSGIKSKYDVIKETVRSIPTDIDTIILAVDAQLGTVIGITENNVKNINITLLNGEANLTNIISAMEGGIPKWVKLNNRLSIMVTRPYSEGILLVGLDVGNVSYGRISSSVLRIAIVVISSYIGIYLYLNYSLKKNSFSDIEKTRCKVTQLLCGQYDVEFEDCRTSEFEMLVSVICMLKEGYIHKTERMNKIFNSISPHIAVFELLNNSQANFFSDNLADVMGISKRDVQNFKINICEFKSLVNDLNKKKKPENGIIQFKNRYLEIHIFETDKEMIGILIDRTQEEKEKSALNRRLLEEQEKSNVDELTGVLNRKGMQEAVQKVLECEKGAGGIMIISDLDNFKKINDSLGHPEGDYALKLFAEVLKKEFRVTDLVGRMGGDEFIVYVPNQMEDGVMNRKLDAMVMNIRKKLIQYSGLNVSASIGVSILDEENGVVDFKTLYESADTALYIAKGLGKDQYYVNKKGIRCMRESCAFCRKECPRREILNQLQGNEE